MTNQRANTRKPIASEIAVIDLDSGNQIGSLLNLSDGGLMLLSVLPIALDRLYRLEIQLASTVNGQSVVQVGADSLWSNTSADGKHYWTGFQIIDISDDNQQIIQQLTNDE